jgi:hypothetical protein
LVLCARRARWMMADALGVARAAAREFAMRIWRSARRRRELRGDPADQPGVSPRLISPNSTTAERAAAG